MTPAHLPTSSSSSTRLGGGRSAVRRSLAASIALSLALVVPVASAQAVNVRWLGTWQSEDGTSRLVITEQQFIEQSGTGKQACRWSITVPKQVKQCMAYYEGTISRAQLQQMLGEAEKQAMALTRQGGLSAQQIRGIQDQFRRNRQVLERISNDSFRLIQTNSPEKEMGSGDCGEVHFLDKETVYRLLQCAPAPDAFSLSAYRKQP